MARGSKKTFKPDYFASLGMDNEGKVDTFAMIYNTMLIHKNFVELSPSAKITYLYCRNQATNTKGRQCLYNHGQEFEREYTGNYFTFPAKHAEAYGMKRQNLNKYLNELIKKGFIEKVESNKNQQKVNIYKFSSKWKE